MVCKKTWLMFQKVFSNITQWQTNKYLNIPQLSASQYFTQTILLKTGLSAKIIIVILLFI